MIAGDANDEDYGTLREMVLSAAGATGLTAEIGVRQGRGSQVIMEAGKEMGHSAHVCIDPYGEIAYPAPYAHKISYDNDMKRRCVADLYAFAAEKNCDLLFFVMESSEFAKRFADGVPVYNGGKSILSSYAFVYLDGQHTLSDCMAEAAFFAPRISPRGLLLFDNVDWYDHAPIASYLADSGFDKPFSHGSASRLAYRKL